MTVVTALSTSTLPDVARLDVAVPQYDRRAVSLGIVHFGVGGFHRSHQAMYLDSLMNRELAHDWGICGVGLLPGDQQMRDVLRAQDSLYTLIVKAPNGTRTARVIGSILDYLYGPDEPEEILGTLTSPDIRVVTLTLTEAGYNVHRVTGQFDPGGPDITHDLAHPDAPRTAFGFVVEALARRRASGLAPFTVVSCDNVQGNGHVARTAFSGFAELRDPELASWVRTHVAFPNSMVDRITPATTDDDRATLQGEYGIADAWPVVCEPFTQWILEDSFGDGRPPFDIVGVQLVADVEPYELMKLRLLNASHQALGYAGYLAGYRYVHEASADPAFVEFLLGYMRDEALPTLPPVPGVDLQAYIAELIERFANPEIRDTLARLCVDASERIPKFLLPVIRHQLDTGGPADRAIAVVACWARYAEGVDEQGEPIEVVDPAGDVLTTAAGRQRTDPLAFVENRDVFGSLVDDERFTRSYRRALSCVHDHGARAVVEALAERGTWD
ncbi:MAG TPA: mannitol dehydrogenase family protein [Jatrophihabitantaceae bacterium]